MSVRFDAAADGLVRTTGLLDYNSPYTFMAWVYVMGQTDWSTVLALGESGATENYDQCGFGQTTVRFSSEAARASTYDGTFDATVRSLGAWYHVAIVRSSVTAFTGYLNAGSLATISRTTLNVTTRTAIARMNIGHRISSGSPIQAFNGRVYNAKAWSAALTPDEIALEMLTRPPTRQANLWAWWPLTVHTDLTDQSGNGRDWTAEGTLTTEADPPAVIPVTVSVTASGAGSWTAPRNVISPITVECWGGGASGGAGTGNPAGGGGGAGGQYAIKSVSVTPGTTYNYSVAATKANNTGAAGSAGNDTTWDTNVVVAKGGANGGGLASTASSSGTGGAGSTTGGVGDTVRAGGNGAAGITTGTGGGGGGGAGSMGTGGNATTSTGGSAGSGTGGGAGSNGSSGANAGAGTQAGGGGGGGGATNATDRQGGSGAAGRIDITYGLSFDPPFYRASRGRRAHSPLLRM